MRGLKGAAVAAMLVGAGSLPLYAFQAKIAELRSTPSTVQAVIELEGFSSGRFAKLLAGVGTLHVRVETELWEQRAVLDRLVRPAQQTFFRVVQERGATTTTVWDDIGQVAAYPHRDGPIHLHVDLAPQERIRETSRYYARAVVTIGSIAEQEIEGVSEAVFGAEGSSGGLVAAGRLLFRKLLQVSDYIQSESRTVSTPPIEGAGLKEGTRSS
jgi:hypothetical protein